MDKPWRLFVKDSVNFLASNPYSFQIIINIHKRYWFNGECETTSKARGLALLVMVYGSN